MGDFREIIEKKVWIFVNKLGELLVTVYNYPAYLKTNLKNLLDKHFLKYLLFTTGPTENNTNCNPHDEHSYILRNL